MSRPGKGWLLAWPPLLYLVIFFLVPTGIVVSYSVLERDYAGGVVARWSPEAWQDATAPGTLRVLARSLVLALGVTLLCLALGYPCAMTLARMSGRWRQMMVILITFPLITSLLLRLYGWLTLLPQEWRGTQWAVGLVLSANYLPFMVLPLLRAWERIDPNLGPAAMDLGATPWQTFWRVTWPLTRAGMWAGCALVFIPAAADFLVPHFIGEGKVRVLGIEIVQAFEQRNFPLTAALAVWLLAVVTVPMLIGVGFRNPEPAKASTKGQGRER